MCCRERAKSLIAPLLQPEVDLLERFGRAPKTNGSHSEQREGEVSVMNKFKAER